MSDYIKREDAIKAMARGLGIPYTDFIDVAERCMDDIPPADVRENVRGEWIDINDENAPINYACSVCGAGIDYRGFANYCPNCGADMRGEA